jgi:hypothetical protein
MRWVYSRFPRQHGNRKAKRERSLKYVTVTFTCREGLRLRESAGSSGYRLPGRATREEWPGQKEPLVQISIVLQVGISKHAQKTRPGWGGSG